MKIKHLVLLLLSLILITNSGFAYKRKPNGRHLKSFNEGGYASYSVYYNHTLSNNIGFYQLLGGSLSSQIDEVSPYTHFVNYQTYPWLTYAGEYPTILGVTANSYIEIGIQYTYPNPEAIGVCADYTTSGSYREFDIIFVSSMPEFNTAINNSNVTFVKNVLRHELVHGIGLDHSSNSNNLMYASLDPNGQYKPVDQDVWNGYYCIYQNSCSGEETSGSGTGSNNGAIEVYNNPKNYTPTNTLKWEIALDDEDIEGFNIYVQDANSSIYNIVNKKNIPFKKNKANYKFHVSDPNKKYFLEIIAPIKRMLALN